MSAPAVEYTGMRGSKHIHIATTPSHIASHPIHIDIVDTQSTRNPVAASHNSLASPHATSTATPIDLAKESRERLSTSTYTPKKPEKNE
ncbi:hypothetical protein B0H12DRAFT_1130264 [Mycena haematopus]|nr:hypothetical protein B0H12DRAFT_1130264 [Mycena haematopus]